MKKHNALFALILAMSFTSNVKAGGKDALIHYGDAGSSEKRQYTMTIKSNDRVTGKITDIATSGSGEDEMDANACYEGQIKDVCELLAVATKELSDKENENYRLKCGAGKENKHYIQWFVKNDRSTHDDRYSQFDGWLYPCDER